MSEMTGSDIVHWAWESWGHAFDKWKASLPDDHDMHYADPYPEQYDAFFAAHPDGWPLHPDRLLSEGGLHVRFAKCPALPSARSSF